MCGGSFISLLLLGLGVYFIYRIMNGFSFTDLKNKFRNTPYEDKDVKYNREKNMKQKSIDDILDKINKVGYNNLTDAEKQKLKNN